jgi:hypothetical protein
LPTLHYSHKRNLKHKKGNLNFLQLRRKGGGRKRGKGGKEGKRGKGREEERK